MPWIVERITLEAVKAAKPSMIFYAVHTTWWTHNPEHLRALKGDASIPLDPRGSPLYETREVEEFLATAEGNPAHYGKHGIRAFMAAHHENMQYSEESARPWSVKTWAEINDLLDQSDDLLDQLDRRAAGS